jgi:isopentenyl diphosphate isomerase/L-lactate dehydrogenase-like FMN-dependent dehydrogenase
MASPYLKAAAQSLDHTVQTIQEIARELQVCMFAAGAVDLDALRKLELTRS